MTSVQFGGRSKKNMDNKSDKNKEKSTGMTLEEQGRRITEAIKLFLQIIGFLGVIASLAFATMEFYHETKFNDLIFKQEITQKNEEIKEVRLRMDDNFREHMEIRKKIGQMHYDVKLIKQFLLMNPNMPDKMPPLKKKAGRNQQATKLANNDQYQAQP